MREPCHRRAGRQAQLRRLGTSEAYGNRLVVERIPHRGRREPAPVDRVEGHFVGCRDEDGELARSLDPLASFDKVSWSRPEIDATAVGEVDREKHARRIHRGRAGCAGRAYRHRSIEGLSLPDAVLRDEDGVTLDRSKVSSQARSEGRCDDRLLHLEVVQRSTRLALLVPPGEGRDGG